MGQVLDIRQIVIISDFDGTITKQDSNDLLFKTFGNEENKHIEKLYAEGTIGTKEGMKQHFNILKLSEKEYVEFINSQIHIDRDFKEFCSIVAQRDIPLAVVSGGFTNAVNLVFQRENINIDNIFANKLTFKGDKAEPEFLHEIDSCEGSFRTCGNCKLYHLKHYRKAGKKVIFIGDGLTDRCIAGQADIVFAKGSLAKYCRENNVDYIEYENFKDVTEALMEMMK